MKPVAKNLFIKLVLAIGFLVIAAIFSESYAAAAAFGEVECGKYETGSEGIKKSEKVKTFTRKFWEIIEFRVPTYHQDLQVKGIVLGDMHFANLGLYYDMKARRANLVVNDLDDAGTNFILGDLMKFLVYLKTIKGIDFKNGDIVDSYIKGLSGDPIEDYPIGLLKKMNIKEDKAVENYIHYLDKKRNEGQKLAKDKPSKSQEIVQIELEKSQLTPLKMTAGLKWVFRESSGSSKDMDRYLYFVKSLLYPNSSEGLLEFKMLKCSAANGAESQNIGANFKAVSQYMRKTLGLTVDAFMKAQDVVFVDGDYYLRRFKAPNLVNDLEITNLSQQGQQEYAEFFARYLGAIHAGEIKKTYIDAIASRKSFILDQAKEITHAFFTDKK